MARDEKGRIIDGTNEGNTFTSENQPEGRGRKKSIKNQLEQILESEDGKMKVPADRVVAVNEDGSVIIRVTTSQLLAQKLTAWAMSKKGNDSLKAIEMIMNRIEGKPTQPLDHQGKQVIEFVAKNE